MTIIHLLNAISGLKDCLAVFISALSNISLRLMLADLPRQARGEGVEQGSVCNQARSEILDFIFIPIETLPSSPDFACGSWYCCNSGVLGYECRDLVEKLMTAL